MDHGERGRKPGGSGIAGARPHAEDRVRAVVEDFSGGVLLRGVAVPSRTVTRLRAGGPLRRVAVYEPRPNEIDRLACAAAGAVYYGDDEERAIASVTRALTPTLH
jgi:hypothetical protein